MAKILVVDDSETLRLQLGDVLQKAGHSVVFGVDGADGIAKAKANSDVQLIISDYNMPEVDGLTMLRKIRELPGYAEKPSFMLTTEASPGLKALGKECGVKAWIVKPFTPDKLLMAVTKIVGG